MIVNKIKELLGLKDETTVDDITIMETRDNFPKAKDFKNE